MTYDALQQRIINRIDAEADSLIRLSKFIHANPEIAMEEVKASAACAEFVEERGFATERGVADLPTAFASHFGEGTGAHVGYLSEYDALPGLGHGCGHNLIAIAGIGAAMGLAEVASEVNGKVSLFGTPAEEAVGGKIFMAQKGVFDGLDAAMGAHPGTSESVCPTAEGSGRALACREAIIKFHGKAAHAAADPFNGINALNAMIEFFNGINALRQHIRSDGRIHGVITDGGHVANVVPDYAAASFMIRAGNLTYMNELVGQVRNIAEGAALMTGATLEWIHPSPANSDMVTNYPLARAMKVHLDALGMKLPDAVAEEAMGSTDWGNVSYVVPSVETTYPILNGVCTWHSPDVVEASISELGFANTILVAKAMALAGLDVMRNAELRGTIHETYELQVPAATREMVQALT
ncbi:MAG TPA: M20 family metallopeptidase [Thermomicrobiales bacterium]|nr:M20 family metallopeptidase [Thermomicrobiales bacterium]